ncbi:MAG: toll/interleukin-1 receptor domain-containing protein [Pseudomonadota bacterium]
MPDTRIGYDAFLSHSHADRAWVHRLAAALAAHDYNGRPLRPWLDEDVLDPGELSGSQELTSALDRSRCLAVVWTHQSAASDWVRFEVQHFEKQAKGRPIVHIEREAGSAPEGLRQSPSLIDATDCAAFEGQLAQVLDRLCPTPAVSVGDAERTADTAFDDFLPDNHRCPEGEPTPQSDAVLDALMRYDIADPAQEGPALAAFMQIASRLAELGRTVLPSTYDAKMLLGDCLAAAQIKDLAYRQIAQRLIDAEDDGAYDPALLAAVVRCGSKLAEIAPEKVDHSVLLRTAAKLDSGHPTGPRRALALLIGRVVGKIRDSKAGPVLLDALCRGGPMARLAFCAAITMRDVVSDSIYFVSPLAQSASRLGEATTTQLPAPSRQAVSELSTLDTFEYPWLSNAIANAKRDLAALYGIDTFGYPLMQAHRRYAGVPLHHHLAPFTGRLVRATTFNMVDLADRVGVGDVVCLTEPRVVDALFDRAGAVVTAEQDPEAPQIKRLKSRAIPFAVVAPRTMAGLRDGERLSFERDKLVIFAADRP